MAQHNEEQKQARVIRREPPALQATRVGAPRSGPPSAVILNAAVGGFATMAE